MGVAEMGDFFFHQDRLNRVEHPSFTEGRGGLGKDLGKPRVGRRIGESHAFTLLREPRDGKGERGLMRAGWSSKASWKSKRFSGEDRCMWKSVVDYLEEIKTLME